MVGNQNYRKNILLRGLIALNLFVLLLFSQPNKTFAEIITTEINGQDIKGSVEFLRDLDFETWQLVTYKDINNENLIILRVIGYPGSLRIDHPTELKVDSGRKYWELKDITLKNNLLVSDPRQAAAEFNLTKLIDQIDKNRPLRLSLDGVFSELPVPPYLVSEWRSFND
tara:strand:- start:18592 stop:19098 length:507 start_codon:yes stop_codon:yes gene_type:complete